MKKLLVAAAIAASAVAANAGCALPGAAACTPPVWDFQMMLRSDNTCIVVGDTTSTHCGLTTAACGCYRELTTLSFSGIWYICDCGCDKMAANINVVMADFTRRFKYGDANFAAKTTKITDPLAFTKLYRVGSYAEKVAALFNLTVNTGAAGEINLALAGFGAFPLEATYFQTLAGYATGLVEAPAACSDSTGVYCGIYDICTPGVVRTNPLTWPAPNETEANAVAYGQFQAKFNAGASARLQATYDATTGNYDVSVIIPSWF